MSDDSDIDVPRAENIHGIDFEWANPASATPLMMAVVSFGDEDRVVELLELGRSPNAADNRGVTPLHVAARSDCLFEVLKHLIRYGGYVNHATHSGVTPLCLAAYGGAFKNVKLLLKSNANCNRKTIIGATPMHYAAHGGSLRIVKLLHKAGAQLDVADDYLRKPLSLAAQIGSVEVCLYLLKEGCSPLEKDDKGLSPLHYACQVNSVEVLNAMVSYIKGDPRSAINMVSNSGWYLTMEAAQRGSTEVLKRLFELGADPEVVNEDGQLALHLATNCSPECFLACLEHTPVRAINRHSVPGAGKMVSLACLLTDSGYANCLDALFSKPGLDPAVTTCPIYPLSLDEPKSPISFTFSVNNAELVSVIEDVLKVFIKHKVPLDVEGCTSCADLLIMFHKNHGSDVECRCQKFLFMLLDSGCMKRVERRLISNFFLSKLLRYGFHNSLVQYINRCTELTPREVFRQATDYRVSRCQKLSKKFVSSLVCLASICQGSTLPFGTYFTIDSQVISLKAMAREAVRNIFKREKVLLLNDLPKPLLEYLDYSEFPISQPNFSTSHF